MQVNTSDGCQFIGRDAREVVRRMADAGWMGPQPKRDWMLGVMERVEEMTGTPMLRFRSAGYRKRAKAFLRDLEKVGLVRVLP